jgi:hypothetical protein
MVSQTRVPQSSFFCQAVLRMRAASSAVGGSGSGCGRDGLLARSAGFTAIHFQRIAVDRAPKRIQWIWRTVELARPLHLCGRQRASQVWSPVVRCSVKRLPLQRRRPVAAQVAAAERGVEGLDDLDVEAADLDVAEHGADVLLDVVAVGAAGGGFDVHGREPLVEELRDGGLGAGVAALVHLAQEAGAGLLRELRGVGAGRDGLRQVVPLAVTGSMPA